LATPSRSSEHDIRQIGSRFPVFEFLGYRSQGESFGVRFCFLTRLTVGKGARELEHFGDPPAILFALELDSKCH
jgi:hypothetical protein